MPQFNYRGRDKLGHLREGQRVSASIDILNGDLIKEGINPFSITPVETRQVWREKLVDWIQGKQLQLEELAVFARQMQLLHKAGVPVVASLNQLAANTRSRRLANSLQGVADRLEKGEGLAVAMQHFPDIYSPLMTNIVQIGENTGHLSEAFEHLYEYLDFESNSIKQIRSAFRYPMFVLISIFIAIIVLNIFVVPSFARVYGGLDVGLPWQTELIIASSNLFTHYGYYLLAGCIALTIFTVRYLRTPEGKYKWSRFQLRVPIIGKLLKRIILIRFCQSLAIVLKSGIPINQGLTLVNHIIQNDFIQKQIMAMQESIQRGVSFTSAISKMTLFTPLEVQILAVGEKSGELSPSLTYIGSFQTNEIQYDLKKLNDFIGPTLLAFVSILILIIALGIYLPIWNMINLHH